jgi:hypothetical protein
MLWEALTGERLFDRDTDFLTYEAIIGAPIPSVNSAGPAGAAPRYPAAIDHVIARALGRDRDTRYATARDLGRDLARATAEIGGPATRDQIADAVTVLCGDQLATRRRAIAAAVARPSAPPPGTAPALGAAAPSPPAQDGTAGAGEAAETISMMMRRDAIVVERSRRTRWWAGALGLAAVAALVAAFAAWRGPGDGPSSPAPSEPAPAIAGRAPAEPALVASGATPVAVDDKTGPRAPLPGDRTAASRTSSPRSAPPTAGSLPPAAPSTDVPPPAAPSADVPAPAAPSAGSSSRTPPAPSASHRPAVTALGDSPGRPDAVPHRGAAGGPSRRPGTPPGTQRKPSTHPPAAPGSARTDDLPASDRAPAAGPSPPAGSPSPTGSTSPAGAPAPAASGWYAIDSNPYATIFVDDRKIGDTPLDRIPLSAGAHRVRAVLADGRQRSFAIDIAPDRKTSSGTLTW